MKIENWEDLPLHALCTMLPEMNDDEYESLCEDIKANGLHDPILVFENEDREMTIIDGRNRRNACMDIGVDPEFDVIDISESNILDFVISKNIKRRQLSTGQLAAMASEVANMEVGDNHTADSKISRGQAASMFGTSEKAVQRYRYVAGISEDLAQQVRSGEATLSAAHGVARDLEKRSEDGGSGESTDSTSAAPVGQEIAERGGPTATDIAMTNPEDVEPEEYEPITRKDVEKNLERIEAKNAERTPQFVMSDVEIDDLMAEGRVTLKSGSLEITIVYGEDR